MWFRRGSFATVALVGALSFGMPTAEAFVVPVPLGQLVFGAVRAAAPEIAAGSSVGPEGTLIVSTVVALGALAYYTKDTWMPWVKGLLGSGAVTSEVNTGQMRTSLTLAVAGSDGEIVRVHGVSDNTWGSGGSMVSWSGAVQCKSAATGVLTTPTFGGLFILHNSEVGDYALATCPSGSTVKSVSARVMQSGVVRSNTVNYGAPFDAYNDSTYRVDSTCRKADGSIAVISATTVNPGNPTTPVEGPAGGGLLVPSCAAQWDGAHSEGLSVNGGQTGSPMHELSHQLFPETSVDYPNCVGAGNACTYVVTYNGVPCVVGQAECVAWEHSRQLVGDAPYGCLFGTYAMTLAQCAVDERVYEPGGAVLTKLNTDGNPNTYDTPAPAWAPQVLPPGGPGGDPLPLPGGGQTPTTTTQTNNSDCWPSGAAMWNPADWVLTPVKCALSWAFVPRTATLATLAGSAKTDLSTQGIGPMVTAVNLNMSKVGSGAGCAGPAVTFEAVGIVKPMYPFSACTTPMSTLAGITKAMTTIAVVLGGGFVAVRAVGAGFGFNFSMRRGGGDET